MSGPARSAARDAGHARRIGRAAHQGRSLTGACNRRSVRSMAEPGSPAEVLIVGGGVAALETLMALGDVAGDRVRVTLVAPEPDFVFRPMAVAEPFGFGEARRYPLRRIVEDFGAELVQAGVAALDAPGGRV